MWTHANKIKGSTWSAATFMVCTSYRPALKTLLTRFLNVTLRSNSGQRSTNIGPCLMSVGPRAPHVRCRPFREERRRGNTSRVCTLAVRAETRTCRVFSLSPHFNPHQAPSQAEKPVSTTVELLGNADTCWHALPGTPDTVPPT